MPGTARFLLAAAVECVPKLGGTGAVAGKLWVALTGPVASADASSMARCKRGKAPPLFARTLGGCSLGEVLPPPRSCVRSGAGILIFRGGRGGGRGSQPEIWQGSKCQKKLEAAGILIFRNWKPGRCQRKLGWAPHPRPHIPARPCGISLLKPMVHVLLILGPPLPLLVRNSYKIMGL